MGKLRCESLAMLGLVLHSPSGLTAQVEPGLDYGSHCGSCRLCRLGLLSRGSDHGADAPVCGASAKSLDGARRKTGRLKPTLPR